MLLGNMRNSAKKTGENVLKTIKNKFVFGKLALKTT